MDDAELYAHVEVLAERVSALASTVEKDRSRLEKRVKEMLDELAAIKTEVDRREPAVGKIGAIRDAVRDLEEALRHLEARIGAFEGGKRWWWTVIGSGLGILIGGILLRIIWNSLAGVGS